MECRFTYTPGEMVQAVSAYRRLKLISTLGWTAGMWIVFGAIFATSISSDQPQGSENSATWVSTLLNSGPIILIPLVFTVYFFTPLWGYSTALFFRRNPLYNQSILYNFEETGFTLQSPVLSQSAAWVAIGKSGETPKGFILFWGKSKRLFHWVPKHGFASENDLNACRELFKRHLTNFKHLD